ncbi:hypothetical protein AAFC00_003060 [Neodothiora populina]|uniref:Telomerase activating protein Est1 n=1 Tax=Neodothiora populina TaxID=2781224 RepID=A0ABR3P956_9PEZI
MSSRKARSMEKQFEQKLADTATPLEEVIVALKDVRAATDEALTRDFLEARTAGVETLLWFAHSQLNARLRKQLNKLRKERSSKPVETRKLTKFYLEFLKDSLRYYRGYIQKLNARFGGIAELQRIARQVKSEPVQPNLQSGFPANVQEQVILSCYQTLIYLGDLFRYRAAERLDKVPDWGPAIGYYALAASLRATSGVAFHQQSVVAFEQGDYLRSTYHLYRAIVVEEPHPNAVANLELQFKKIIAGWNKGDLVPKNLPHDKTASRKALVAWFIRFHSMCYRGKQFSQYEELEKEVLSRTESELKNGTLDGVLPKIMFINFAAQACAATRLQQAPDREEYMQAYFFFLRLNVRFFITLLDSYTSDLDKVGTRDQGPKGARELSQAITDQARHVLPCLRLYSAWLLGNAHLVAAGVGDDDLLKSVDQFWMKYASTLSAVAIAFPYTQLPEAGYQLEEDVDAYGFLPLISEHTQSLWRTPGSTENKPKFNDMGLPRLAVDIEMLARLRDLQYDAMRLAVDDDVPITYDGTRFVVQEKPPAEVTQSPIKIKPQLEQMRLTPPAPEQQTSSERVPETVRAPPKTYTMEANLRNMVDDLVGPEDDDENLPPTPPMQQQSAAMPMLNAATGTYFETDVKYGSYSKGSSPRPIPPIRTPEIGPNVGGWQTRSSQRIHSVSSVWNDIPHNTSPLTPNPHTGFATRRVSSNASMYPVPSGRAGHTRVNSATSLKSSLPNPDGWDSFEPTPQPLIGGGNGRYDNRVGSLHGPGSYSGMQSPLLFGAGGGPWSTGPRGSFSNTSPSNGQGG